MESKFSHFLAKYQYYLLKKVNIVFSRFWFSTRYVFCSARIGTHSSFVSLRWFHSNDKQCCYCCCCCRWLHKLIEQFSLLKGLKICSVQLETSNSWFWGIKRVKCSAEQWYCCCSCHNSSNSCSQPSCVDKSIWHTFFSQCLIFTSKKRWNVSPVPIQLR